jgi:hypothetical protein
LSLVFCAAAALTAFAAYLFGISPSAYWLDSAELVAGAHTLGVPHPPGHPLYALSAKLFALLPVGSIPLRVNLASAAALAAAVGLLAALLDRLAGSMGWEGRARAPAAAAVAAAVGLSYGAAFQAVRAEVYALHLLCALAFVHLALRFGEAASRDSRWLMLASGVAGLGLSNHHYLFFLAGVPVAAYALWRARGRSWRWLGAASCALLLGVSLYLYLPLRAGRSEVNWGDPARADRFAWVVSARAFQKSVRPRPDAALGDHALALAGVTMEALTPFGAALGLVGLAFLIRRRRALGLALGGAGLLTFGSQILMPVDPGNPDVHGYLLLWLALLAAGAFAFWGALVAALTGRAAWGAAAATAVLSLGLAAAQGARAAPRWSLDGFWGAEDLIRPILAAAPARALLLSSYFKSVFAFWHARAVENERPDVALVHRNFLRYPGYAGWAARRHPGLGDLLRAYARDGRFPAGSIEEIGTRRPVLAELDLNLQPDLARALRPRGWIWEVGSPPPEKEVLAERERFWRDAYARRGDELGEPETRRYFLWSHYLHALAARAHGWQEVLRAEVRRGLALAPGSPELRALLGASPRGGGP